MTRAADDERNDDFADCVDEHADEADGDNNDVDQGEADGGQQSQVGSDELRRPRRARTRLTASG